MPVFRRPQDLVLDDVYVDIEPLVGRPLMLKCEGFNFAGSIKLKPAADMVAAAERDGVLRQGSVIVESSSGNLGVALAVVAANRGYRLVCVCDPRVAETNRRLIERYGGEVVTVTEPDERGGYLGTRIGVVRRLCRENPDYVWLNQYTNPHNPRSHHDRTARSIFGRFPQLDLLFVGAGTTGTLMGCARYVREHRLDTRVVAVDSFGSVTFGGPPGPRFIPGLGTSTRPALLDADLVDDLVLVDERDAVAACRRLATNGYLFGGSTGTVLAGALHVLGDHPGGSRAVAIAPDLGERYLTTIYDDAWVAAQLPGPATPPQRVALGGRPGHRRPDRPDRPGPPAPPRPARPSQPIRTTTPATPTPVRPALAQDG
ncbi:MAG TPA: 2,3-diaminopropionate biosynthesis protein SbnA [Mycobacteriales bacterium]|nr:2,3-diaminopropionate biosynthesis protein SbnA [Mycobacteriales bacterium]